MWPQADGWVAGGLPAGGCIVASVLERGQQMLEKQEISHKQLFSHPKGTETEGQQGRSCPWTSLKLARGGGGRQKLICRSYNTPNSKDSIFLLEPGLASSEKDELLNKERISQILHLRFTMRCLLAGRPLLTQKPCPVSYICIAMYHSSL